MSGKTLLLLIAVLSSVSAQAQVWNPLPFGWSPTPRIEGEASGASSGVSGQPIVIIVKARDKDTFTGVNPVTGLLGSEAVPSNLHGCSYVPPADDGTRVGELVAEAMVNQNFNTGENEYIYVFDAVDLTPGTWRVGSVDFRVL